MLKAPTHTVTRIADGDSLTLVFYPDTGCLRIADGLGVCHEMRPPHSWLAISAASRGVRRGAHALADALSVLLHDFCTKRPRLHLGPVRLSARSAPDAWFDNAARVSRTDPLDTPSPDATSTAAVANVR
jgi:hypothetical protein